MMDTPVMARKKYEAMSKTDGVSSGRTERKRITRLSI